jgi:hypothetical protein
MNSQPSLPPQPTHPLEQFNALIGKWATVGTHPMIPSAVHGHSTFEWLREGVLLIWHFRWDESIPNAYSIIGHDDTVGPCTMLYSDERGVARIYQMTLDGRAWAMWRESPGFSQRMTGTLSDDGNTIVCHGEWSRDGSTWERDLDVLYSRVAPVAPDTKPT